ncbi:MAG TPA: hypothetical protein QGH16_06110 [Verrucomicrobiota bacterium]|nr:hypothetical protein [Verrucomicrobiota bacterium]
MIIAAGGINGPKITIQRSGGGDDDDLVGLQLFFGTDISLFRDAGDTPLDSAAKTEKIDLVEFLQTQRRLGFAWDDDDQCVIRVKDP